MRSQAVKKVAKAALKSGSRSAVRAGANAVLNKLSVTSQQEQLNIILKEQKLFIIE